MGADKFSNTKPQQCSNSKANAGTDECSDKCSNTKWSKNSSTDGCATNCSNTTPEQFSNSSADTGTDGCANTDAEAIADNRLCKRLLSQRWTLFPYMLYGSCS